MKRKSFEHEKEVRAFWLDPNFESGNFTYRTGVDISIYPKALIERIYLAPACGSWIKPVVEATLDHFGLKGRVIQSSLNDGPA